MTKTMTRASEQRQRIAKSSVLRSEAEEEEKEVGRDLLILLYRAKRSVPISDLGACVVTPRSTTEFVTIPSRSGEDQI